MWVRGRVGLLLPNGWKIFHCRVSSSGDMVGYVPFFGSGLWFFLIGVKELLRLGPIPESGVLYNTILKTD